MDNTTGGWHLTGNDGVDPMNHFLGTLNPQALVLRTDHWANPAASERMRISASGNVGIGTDDLRQGRLVIEDAAVPLAFKETGQGAASGGLWRLVLDGGALRFESNTAAGGDFSSYNTPLSIAPGGNLGLGTAPQAARLSVAATNGGIVVDSAASNNPAITLRSSGAGWGSGLQLHNSTANTGRNYGLYAGSDGSLHLSDTTSGADRLIVSNAGTVGIGVASPQRALSVSAALNVDQANANGGALNPGVSFGSNSGEGISSKRSAGGNQAGLDLYTNNAARLSITNSGNVGIGTSNPTARLEVSGGDIRLEAGRTFYSPGRMHVHGEELLYVLNKSGMVVGKEWGGNGNLNVQGNLEALTESSPIRVSSGWTGFPDPVANRAEISNDTATYKTLMIVGNKSAGLGRRVSVWDRLEVNGSLFLNGVNMRQTLVQSGEASPGELRSSTGQMIDKRGWVSFPVHYSEPPRVVLTLKACDVNRNFNQRLDMWTSNVTTYGFYANFRTWADTHFYLISAYWIAHGWQ